MQVQKNQEIAILKASLNLMAFNILKNKKNYSQKNSQLRQKKDTLEHIKRQDIA